MAERGRRAPGRAPARPDRRLHVFPDTLRFGRRLARALDCGLARVAVHRFPDGESLVRVGRPVGRHAVLVRSLHDPNAKLVEVLLAARLAGLPWTVGRKVRLGDRAVRIRLVVPPTCRRAVLVDDIASTGETLAAAAQALRRLGVRRIDTIVVHALFAPGALRRIRAAGVRR